MFTFRTASTIAAVPLALGFAAILICGRSKVYWFIGVALLTCAISIYQMVVNYLAIVILFGIAFEFLHRGFHANWWRNPAIQTGLLVTGVICFLTIVVLTSRVSGDGLGSRTVPLPLAENGSRIVTFENAAGRVLFADEPVLPVWTKALLLMMLAGGVLLFVAKAVAGERQPLVIWILSGIAAFPLCFGIILALKEWWLTPRVISQTSVYFGAMIAMAYLSAGARFRRSMMIAVTAVLLSFIGINEEVFADQLRVNIRDFAKANRIIMRIEELPGFGQINSVVLSGGWWGYGSPIRTQQGDMNISALYAEWSKTGVLNELSGYSFKDPPADIKADVAKLCSKTAMWPAKESVQQMGTIAVVCMGDH
jgi:hypothetical protein